MILPQMSDSAVRTKNKKLHKQSHREVDPFALLLCHFLFLFYYTLFFRFEEFPINQEKVSHGKLSRGARSAADK